MESSVTEAPITGLPDPEPETDHGLENENDTDYTRWPVTGRPETEPEPAADLSTPPTPPAQLPDDGEDEEEAPDALLHLLGHRELGLKVGGRKPDSSVLKVKGGKIEIDGMYDRGDRFPVVFDLQVTSDEDADSIETATGTVKSTRKTQGATVCGTTSLPEYLKLKLADHPEVLAVVLTAVGVEDEA